MPDQADESPIEPEALDVDSLDYGLGVAFAGDGRRPGEGVAAAIDRMTGGAPRPLLPDDGDGPTPVLRVLPGGGDRLGDDGRYEALGEIARGGLGIVLKGRDRDLGRDVAIKVLRPEFAKNDAVLARFVEEAQIGGQLQHPGLVPVYSMGLDSEGRPFFAMKLVKGRTLASLLVDRKSPTEGLRRHLAVFESVCRTTAYAHSRRVVHRDLKPSNVMLGAFGEVQVVDWGLAKVLGRGDVPGVRPAAAADPDISLIATVRSGSAGSGSLAGSVLGTPGYLSPEQALGRIDDVDERTDVFALGSILCEILTGEPPFTGDARDQILLAARGDTSEAQARLDACGADPAIVAIAKKCLATDRGDRYRDAGELAEAVTAHLSGAESRARQAEVAAAEARAKAEEERTLAARERSTATRERAAQRRTMAVSCVALCAVVAAIVVWRDQAAAEADRSARATAAVSDALAGANAKRGAKDMVGALAAAQKAAALATSGQVDAETTDRAAKLLAEVQAEEYAARVVAVQAAKDEAFAAAMGRAHEVLDNLEDLRQATDDRFAAFREYGVDLETCDVETGAALLRASPRLADMTAVLDEWARAAAAGINLMGSAAAVPRSLIVRVAKITCAADPDPWRAGLRAAYSPDESRSMANAPEMETQPDTALDWLAFFLDPKNGRNTDLDKAALLKVGRVQARRHPGRPWLGAASMASAPYEEGADRLDPHAMNAARTARVALRPGVNRWQCLGDALLSSDETPAAIAAYEQAVRLDPGSQFARAFLLLALNSEDGSRDGRLKEVLDAAERRAPNDARIHLSRGRLLARAGEFAAAEASLRKAVALQPEHGVMHAGLAGVLLGARKFDEALVEYREAVRLEPGRANLSNLIQTLLRLKDVDAALAEAKRAVDLFPSDPDILGSCASAYLRASTRANRADDREKALALADTAVEMCRKALATSPRDAERHKELAQALEHRASVADDVCHEAVVEYREAIRLEADPRSPSAHQVHEWFAGALVRLGRRDEARAEYATALRLNPHCPEANGAYGVELARSGSDDERGDALGRFRAAAAGAPDLLSSRVGLIGALLEGQSGPAIRRAAWKDIEAECRRTLDLAAKSPGAGQADDDHVVVNLERALGYILDPKFPETVRGDVKPADRGEARDLVWACNGRRLYAAAARFAACGLSAECKPRETAMLDATTREALLYDGARAAVCAADGQGEDADTLDPAMRAQWRRQALAWLRDACALDADRGGGPQARRAVRARNRVAHAPADRRLDSVRESDALAKLPLEDRVAWERFWSEVRRAVRSFSEKGK